jgi:hypothetical protein
VNADGSALLFSTYYGGSDFDTARGLELPQDGRLYIVGTTRSADLPVGEPLQGFGGLSDGFASSMTIDDVTGGTLVSGTFIGGSGTDDGWGIAVRPNGPEQNGNLRVYVVADTTSADIDTTKHAVDDSYNGSFDGLIIHYKDTARQAASRSTSARRSSNISEVSETTWPSRRFSATSRRKGPNSNPRAVCGVMTKIPRDFGGFLDLSSRTY